MSSNDGNWLQPLTLGPSTAGNLLTMGPALESKGQSGWTSTSGRYRAGLSSAGLSSAGLSGASLTGIVEHELPSYVGAAAGQHWQLAAATASTPDWGAGAAHGGTYPVPASQLCQPEVSCEGTLADYLAEARSAGRGRGTGSKAGGCGCGGSCGGSKRGGGGAGGGGGCGCGRHGSDGASGGHEHGVQGGNPWAIDDPRHNLVLLAQELLLLEGHLADPERKCPSCITKHALSARSLAEEGRRLDGGGKLAPVWQQASGLALSGDVQEIRRLRQRLVEAVVEQAGSASQSDGHRGARKSEIMWIVDTGNKSWKAPEGDWKPPSFDLPKAQGPGSGMPMQVPGVPDISKLDYLLAASHPELAGKTCPELKAIFDKNIYDMYTMFMNSAVANCYHEVLGQLQPDNPQLALCGFTDYGMNAEEIFLYICKQQGCCTNDSKVPYLDEIICMLGAPSGSQTPLFPPANPSSIYLCPSKSLQMLAHCQWAQFWNYSWYDKLPGKDLLSILQIDLATPPSEWNAATKALDAAKKALAVWILRQCAKPWNGAWTANELKPFDETSFPHLYSDPCLWAVQALWPGATKVGSAALLKTCAGG